MAYDNEMTSMRNDLETIEVFLQELYGVRIIKNAYEDEFETVENALENIKVELNYVEAEDDNAEISMDDVGNCKEDIDRVRRDLRDILHGAETALSNLDDAEGYLPE